MKIFTILTSSIIFILFSLTFSSCKKDDSNNPSVSATITNGSWLVSYYHDKIKDETSDFAGNTFTFQQNGQLNVTTSSGNSTGSWSIVNSDDNGGSQKLNLFAGT